MSQVVLTHDEAVVQLAEDFVARYRRGEAPSLKEYVERFPEMATEIESLVDALLFMEKLGSKQSGKNKASEDQPPEFLGEYRILGELGRGGMGVVYEAMQSSLNRKVAIKVLPSSSTQQPLMKERFLREARTAAGLHHSHIVPVHGVGEQNGACYFVMQLIDGISCDRILHQLRQMRTQPATTMQAQQDISTRISTRKPTGETSKSHSRLLKQSQEWLAWSPSQRCREVARLGAAMAEALAYAHEQQVVHRDIKPGNILIDDHQQPWLNDFGLARPMEGSDLTASGQVVGTLRYLPPERFEGESTATGDIYSLGITLYELMTLQHPFTGNDHARVIRQIHQEIPAPLTTVIPEIPRDLNTIIMKCLAKRPEDRYQQASTLAADLRAVLADQPISARPLRWWEKTGRWMRRNPAIASLTTLLFAVLVTGMIAVTWLWLESEWHREEADKQRINVALERDAVREQRDVAKANLVDAVDAVDQFYNRVSDSALFDKPGMEVVRKQLLQDGINYYRSFLLRHANDPSLLREIAKAYSSFGSLQFQTETREAAAASLRKSGELYKQLIASAPSNKLRLELVKNNIVLYYACEFLGKFKDCRDVLDESQNELDLLKPGMEHDPKYLVMQAMLFHVRAKLSSKLKQGENALQQYTQALTCYNELCKLTPLNAIHRKEYARALIDLGNCFQIVFKEHDKAVEHLEQAQQQLLLLKFTSTLGSSLDRDLARCNNILANSYSVLKQYDKADYLFAKSQEEHKRLAQLYPMNLEYITGQAHSHKYSAKSYYNRENYTKAIEQYLLAERIFLQVLQKENRLENVRGSLIDTQTEMGRCYLFTNDNDGSLACFERLQENWLTYQRLFPNSYTIADRRDFSAVLGNLALSYMRKNRLPDAEKAYQQAIVAVNESGRMDPKLRLVHEYLSNYQLGLGRVFVAQNRLKEAVDTFETMQQHEANNPDRLYTASRELALCLAKVNTQEQSVLHQRCALLALSGLKRTIAAKDQYLKQLEADKAWVALRQHPEFSRTISR